MWGIEPHVTARAQSDLLRPLLMEPPGFEPGNKPFTPAYFKVCGVMHLGGLEPPPCTQDQVLNLTRLPIPPQMPYLFLDKAYKVHIILPARVELALGAYKTPVRTAEESPYKNCKGSKTSS